MMSFQGDLLNRRIALVHDELTRRGGAERVFEDMIRLFPQADIYALYAGYPVVTIDGRRHDVTTTFLQRLPAWFRRHPSRLLPLLPYAAEQLDLARYDIVISSASAFAKGIVTRASVPHICYCHAPTRYVWDGAYAVLGDRPLWQRAFGKPLLHWLRMADFAAAQRVDYFIANSTWTAQRIQTFYRQSSTVVYPPIDTAFFTPAPRPATASSEQYFLCVGRLSAAKHFDQAISVCEKLGLRLIIIGEGPEAERLKKMTSRHTQIISRVDRHELRTYYRNAAALLQPGEEDFGMASAEALACGTPVIAYGVGGSREVVHHRQTGYLYPQPTVENLAEAVRWFMTEASLESPGHLQESTLRFSKQRFSTRLPTVIAQVYQSWLDRLPAAVARSDRAR